MEVRLTGRLAGEVVVTADDAETLEAARSRLETGGISPADADGGLAIRVDGDPAEVAELLQRVHALAQGPWTGPGA